MTADYVSPGPSREEVDASAGPVLLEFGAGWCGHCQAAAPAVAAALAEFPATEHIKIEDGPGRPLGRSFRVKLWPTLVFLKHGVEIARLVRPEAAEPIREALRQIG
jgi:thioredoxin 1